MSEGVLDLNGIKALYAKGMQYAKDHFPKGLFSRNDSLCDYQLSLVNKAQDLTTLANAISINNAVWSTAFKGPKPICRGCEIQYTPMQFGVSNNGWYFNYGVAGDMCFVFGLNRIELAPPCVVEKERLDPSEAVLWSLGGGFGKIGGPWYNFPSEYFYMKYDQPTYSTFSLVGRGTQVKNATLTTGQSNPMQFTMSADFISPTDGKEHSINVTMTANTPPLPNVPGACGLCVDGMGTMYYSYTDMDVVVSVDKGNQQSGKGWIDHQLFKTGVPRNLMSQAQKSVANTLVKPVSGGWLWFAIQDYESDTQYLLTHFFVNKFYKDSIKLNENIPMQIVNVYKKGEAHFNPTRTDMDSFDLQVKMTKTINVNGLDLPAEYDIILPGGKPVILTLASGPDQYPYPFGSYENPALLFNRSDTGRTKPIGIGIIEANGYFTNDQYAQRYVKAAGGDVNDQAALDMVSKAMSPNLPQTGGQRFLAFLIVLIPLWLLIIALVFILHDKKGRHPRLMIAIAVLLILYGITYSSNSSNN
jgi:hypothetical protein